MKRPLKNAFAVVVGDAGSRAVGFVVTAYLARVLGVVGFGELNVGLAVLAYLGLVGSPGIQILESRNTALPGRMDDARVSDILSLRMALAFGLILATCMVSIVVLPAGATRDVILLLSFALIPLALSLDWFFAGKEKFLTNAIGKMVSIGVYGGVVMAWVTGSDDIRHAALAFVLGNVAATTYLLFMYSGTWGRLRMQVDMKSWRTLLAENVPVGISSFLAQSVVNLPPIVLAIVGTAGDAGTYSAGAKLISVVLVLDRLFNALFLPVITRYAQLHRAEVVPLVSVSLRMLISLAAPLILAALFLAGPAVSIAFGPGYPAAAPVVQVLMGYFGLTVINSLFTVILIGHGAERAYNATILLGSAVTVAAIVAGTAAGPVGAAWGVVAGEATTALLMGVRASRVAGINFGAAALRPLAAVAGMAGIAALLADVAWVGVPASCGVFVILMILFRGMNRNDWRMVRERIL